MHIAFEAKRAFNNFTGLGNYSRFVISALKEHYPADQYSLFTPKTSKREEAALFYKENKDVTILPSGLWKVGSMKSGWRSRKIGKLAVKQKADVFHGLSNELPSGLNSKTKKIVTIHDLIFLRYPDFYPFLDRKIYKRKFKSACKRADQIIAISEQTKEDIVEFLGIDSSKINVIYQGVHPIYKQDLKTRRLLYLLDQYSLHQPYFLYVGSIEDRKNAKDLVQAFKLVLDQVKHDLLLLIVGKKTDYQREVEKEIKRLKLDQSVRIYNNIPFTELPYLYKGAVASVYPSSFEGFGIPVLESLAVGTSVVTGKQSAMKEAGGKQALYADPKNHEELASQMVRLADDNEFNEQMLIGLEEHLAKFSSEKIAGDIMKLYQK
ncbi:Glycosyltransferase involved in cell wall bisynthesis [Marivirga sericea]|uniref:Glycosyltransferase involved in cell wall bisynthesis n=1 Tax=Marivirga sericea TaxID=1028 RepID=A0A1X7K0C7_9BACT|nr:glycosyltransferase family 1 protein [Marivirga sericea]SMG33637.1 Glycosyltransferase involved in cell wall bisynthesis [Marivirga sericea]